MLEDIGFFQLAKRASKNSDHPRVNIGAVIALNGKPVSFGWNKDKTHPEHANPTRSIRKSIHAEVDVVLSSDCDVSGGVIYIWRNTKDGKPALSRPCNYCYSFLQRAGIRVIHYTISQFPYHKMERL